MGEFLASCGALTQSTILRTHQNNGARKFGRPAAFQAIKISPATAQGWVIKGNGSSSQPYLTARSQW